MNKLFGDHIFFTLEDVKQLYISNRSKIYKSAFVCGIFVFLGLGLLPTKYKIKASFKESSEQSPRAVEGVLKELLGGIQSTEQSQIVSSMKSFQVLKPLVEKLGLQITPFKQKWFITTILRRYVNNFRAEKKLHPLDANHFIFKDVCYEEDFKLYFFIKFKNSSEFTIHSANKEYLGDGIVGTSTNLESPSARFTLREVPKNVKLGKYYSFSLIPWISVAEDLQKDLQIVRDKSSKSIYTLKLYANSRELGAEIINGLMEQYQRYLKKEYDDLAKQQLVYLENKQEEVCAKLTSILDEHANYFRKNLQDNGFIGLNDEGKGVLEFYQEIYRRFLLTDTLLARLEQTNDKNDNFLNLIESDFLPSGFSALSKNLREFQQQKDLLEASLSFSGQQPILSWQARAEELKKVREQRYAVEKTLSRISSGEEIASLDFPKGISVSVSQEKQDVIQYLDHYSRLLSVREKMLQESSVYEKNRSSELEGIDLNTARALLVQYNTQLDQVESKLRHFTEYTKEINRPDFEVACLANLLQDSVSQKLIAETSALNLKLKNEKYHSSKESVLWAEEIALNKKILSEHLHQLCKIETLNGLLLKEKMFDLQKISLDCVNRQISVLYEQVLNSIKNYRTGLIEEKKILQNKMNELKKAASGLPDRWRLEKWLAIKTEIVGKIMETVAEIAESKTISSHLYRVASKPLDVAVLPLAPEKPHLFSKSIVAAFVGALVCFLTAFFKQASKGFPLSLDKLKFFRLPVLGTISFSCDGPCVENVLGPDLEVLRKLVAFSSDSKVIGLITGDGPDYSYALGENISLFSKKSVILRCDFHSKFHIEDSPGLLQIWKNEIKEIPLREGKNFQYITAGGYTPFGTELMQSPNFTTLLEKLKKEYDFVFLFLKGPISSVQSNVVLKHCDKTVVTISKETIEEVTLFTDWADHNGSGRLTFITSV
jgi:hypothetical protein